MYISVSLEDMNNKNKEIVVDKADFDEVVRQNYQKLYHYIRRMVVVHEDADDVLQETFIKAWRNFASFRNESSISSWLYRIASNEAINHLNKKKRTFKAFDGEGYDFLADNLQADDYFDGDAAQLEFQKAVATLPEKQRLVFTLKYFEEKKYSEIVDILGGSEGSLKASYHHAVQKIEKYFKDKD
ncbi:MAG: RNA polymerase sigma factor [Bacteroidales bacterium]